MAFQVDSVSDLPAHRGDLSEADQALIAGARRREPRALGRLISLFENVSAASAQPDRLAGLRAVIASAIGKAHVVGVTGPPGVGKSSLTASMVAALRSADRLVAVVAVDPSSPFTGGALLGDRVRMQRHACDPGVFIRSMSSRGHVGGLAVATFDVLRVLDWANFEVVLVETVGVGQSEVEVTRLADTTVVTLAPGLGDSVQAAKAGLLEVADIFVVNKSDLPGAQAVVRDLRTNLSMGREPEWKPPILMTISTQDEGVADVVNQVDAHRDEALASGAWQRRRDDNIRDQITSVALARLRADPVGGGADLGELARLVQAGELDTHRAAEALLNHDLSTDDPPEALV